MGLLTIGRDFYSGCELPFWVQTTETFAPDLGRGERFRPILVEGGTGILRLAAFSPQPRRHVRLHVPARA